ncbi:GlxA family transcriptional regulator [Salinisphaera orenii]|uniref:GlxA family transcriptional regulator n=1 Tax=Salinisphaera orenii TaxID=856731 RepID=UPI0018C8AFF6
MWLPAPPAERTFRIGFLLVPQFSHYAFTSAVEPLRMANQLAKQTLYEWPVISVDGAPVTASNGLSITPDHALRQTTEYEIVFVCGGTDIQYAFDESIAGWLRRLARDKVALGGLCTGTYILARANLLDGYKATIHWQQISSIHEELLFPQTQFVSELFVTDRDRYTCSGGVAPLDLMLNIIRKQQGASLAEAISEEFIHERIRLDTDSQRNPLRAHLGSGHPKMEDAVRLMEANIEEPLTLDELAYYVGVSRRQLERLFKKYINNAPTRYYLALRLNRARQLLLQTNHSIIEVATACGFASPSHFSKCYHDFFGRPPNDERSQRSALLKADQ